MSEKKDYELEALLFAEKYGIIEYEVEDHMMKYYESYPNEGTYLHQRNLETSKSLRGILIKKPY